MGDREIREKYGGKLPKAINRAIRAEVPGGNEALEKLTQLAGAARQSRWKDHAGRETPEAQAYFKHKREVVDCMDAQVRQKWGVPPDRNGPPRRRADSPRRQVGTKNSGGRPRATPGRSAKPGGGRRRSAGGSGDRKSPSRPRG